MSMPTHASVARWLPEVLDAYGHADRDEVSPLLGGTANPSFVVGTRARVIVTFCVGRPVAEVSRLAALLDHLEDHGVRSNRIKRTREGASVYITEGTAVIMKDFIEGAAVQTIDETLAYRLGVVLAELHAVPAPEWLADDHPMGYITMQRMATRARDEEFATWLTHASEALDLRSGELPRGLVHGDLFPDNLIACHDGSLIAIDFEEACRYSLVFDIGMALVGMTLSNALTPPNIEAVLASYQSRRTLAPLERACVPTMVECAACMVACWRYELSEREAPPTTELRDWRQMQATHELSRSWRRDGIWASLLD